MYLYSFILYLVAQNTWMPYYTLLPECYSVYLVIFTIYTSLEGCFVHPLRGGYSPCPPNRGIPL